MDVDAVVFDLDGTLFDHERSARAGLTAWLGSLQVDPSVDLFEAWFEAEERHTTAWRAGECSWGEQRRRRLRDILPLMGRSWAGDDELDAVFQGYLSAYEAAWRPFDDAHGCLTAVRARGYQLALLTNGAEGQQRAKLAAVGMDGVFEHVLTAEALGVGKPDPLAYRAACTALRLPPHRCVHVGDDHELDVVGPRAIGMHAVHLDRDGRRIDGTGCIRSLDELAGHLDGPVTPS